MMKDRTPTESDPILNLTQAACGFAALITRQPPETFVGPRTRRNRDGRRRDLRNLPCPTRASPKSAPSASCTSASSRFSGRDLDETTLDTNVLDKLRNAITSVTGAAPGSIDADTRLSTLFPFVGRKTAWKRLEQSLGLSLPPLERPRLIRTIGIVVGRFRSAGSAACWRFWPSICRRPASWLRWPRFSASCSDVISILAFWLVGRWLTCRRWPHLGREDSTRSAICPRPFCKCTMAAW